MSRYQILRQLRIRQLRLRLWWQHLFHQNPQPPQAPPADPFAYGLVPVRRGPRPRSGAAVAEPEEDFQR